MNKMELKLKELESKISPDNWRLPQGIAKLPKKDRLLHYLYAAYPKRTMEEMAVQFQEAGIGFVSFKSGSFEFILEQEAYKKLTNADKKKLMRELY